MKTQDRAHDIINNGISGLEAATAAVDTVGGGWGGNGERRALRG